MKLQNFNRTGNWYTIKLDDTNYNVLIQKEPNSIFCEPSSVIIFDENLQWVEPHKNKKNIYDIVEDMMNKVDWKYDMVDED